MWDWYRQTRVNQIASRLDAPLFLTRNAFLNLFSCPDKNPAPTQLQRRVRRRMWRPSW